MRAWKMALGMAMSATAWAAPIETTSARVTGEDYQIDYAASKTQAISVVSPPGVPVEILEGLNRVAKGRTPLTYEPTGPGIFIVALHPSGGASWETHVTVRSGFVARLKASPSHARATEASLRPTTGEPDTEPLSALEFAALRLGLKGQTPVKRMPMLERLSGSARFTARQADELVGLFGKAERPRVLRWVRARTMEPVATRGVRLAKRTMD